MTLKDSRSASQGYSFTHSRREGRCAPALFQNRYIESRLGLSMLLAGRSSAVEYFDEVINATFKCFGEP